MVDVLSSWGWKRANKEDTEETEIDKQMDYEAVFKLVDVNNSGFITKTVGNFDNRSID